MKLNLNDRSDKLLITLSCRLSKASSLASEALLVWQELTEAEQQLKKAEESRKKDKARKAKIEQLYGECRRLASDLKDKYDEINGLLTCRAGDSLQLFGLVLIPIKRLMADYGPSLRG